MNKELFTQKTIQKAFEKIKPYILNPTSSYFKLFEHKHIYTKCINKKEFNNTYNGKSMYFNLSFYIIKSTNNKN